MKIKNTKQIILSLALLTVFSGCQNDNRNDNIDNISTEQECYETYNGTAMLEECLYNVKQKEVKEEKNNIQNQITTLEADKTNLQNDINDLDNKINELNNNKLVLENQLNDLNSQNSILETDKLDLQNQITNLDNQITTLEADKTNLQNDIIDKDNTITNLQNQINDLTKLPTYTDMKSLLLLETSTITTNLQQNIVLVFNNSVNAYSFYNDIRITDSADNVLNYTVNVESNTVSIKLDNGYKTNESYTVFIDNLIMYDGTKGAYKINFNTAIDTNHLNTYFTII